MRWRWRRPRVWLRALLIALGALLVSLAFLLGTTPGARWVISLALDRVPQEISIADIEGRLAGSLTLHDLRVGMPAAEISVGLVELEWSPTQLIRRHLRIKRLVVEGVSVRMLSATKTEPQATSTPSRSPGPIPPPDLPLEIVVDQARISQVQVLLEGDLEVSDLHLTLHGRPEDYRLQIAGRLEGQGLPTADMTMTADGDLSSLVVEPLTVSTLGGRMRARARAEWYPQLTWRISVRADSLGVGRLAPQPEKWPGILNAELTTEGRFDESGEPVGWAELDTLSGGIRGEVVGGHGRVDFSGREHAKVDLDVGWANFLASVSASVGDSVEADVRLTCPDLASLPIAAAGSVDVSAKVRGPLRSPRVEGTVGVDSLRLPQQQIAVSRIAAKVGVDLADEGSGHADAEIIGLASGSAVVDSVRLVADGTRARHRVRLAMAGREVHGLVAVEGTLAPDSLVWSGTLDTLHVANPRVGVWHLDRPVQIVAGRAAASVDSLRLVQGEASVALGGAWNPSRWSAAGALEHVPLEVVNAWLPPERTLHGVVGATFHADGTSSGEVDGELTAGLADARLVFAVAGAPDSLVFQDARVQAAMGDSGVVGSLSLTALGAVSQASVDVHGRFALPQYTTLGGDARAQPLTATLRADLPDLGVFAGLDPHATGLAGKVTLSVDATGTVGEPEVAANLRATGLQATVPDLGVTLRDGELLASGSPGEGFTLSGGARSGAGEIRIDGHLPSRPSSETPIEVSITGDRFQVMSTPEIQAVVRPDLRIRYDSGRLDVDGTIALPTVHVELVELPPSAVRVSRDVVVVEEESEPMQPLVDTWVDVQVVLGDDVTFKGFGASVALEGGVQVKQHVPKPPEVNGEIRIREGQYRAYGQNLTIDEGTISFVGPAENPNLRMRAYRKAFDGVIAGVRILGTAEQPELRIYSEPAMPDANAISYLVTGRPPQPGSGGSQMAGAAALLGSNVLSSAVGSKLGLDEAQVETGGSLDEAALVTGKYLTPNFYISYAMGLFDRSNLVRLRYILSPNWAVQTETGSTQGADVFYEFERGGPRR